MKKKPLNVVLPPKGFRLGSIVEIVEAGESYAPLLLAAPRLARAIQNAVKRLSLLCEDGYGLDYWEVIDELAKIERNLRDALREAATPDAKD